MVDIIKQDMTDIWAVAGDVVAPDSAKVRGGWGVEAVPRQWWNWFENRQDTNIAYMLQKGIPEWDQFTEYLTNKSYVQRNNVVYKCILTGVNKDPLTFPANWVKAFPESSAYLETIRPLAVSNNTMAYIDGSGAAQNTPATAFGRSGLNVADAAAARTLYGAQQANSNLSALSAVTASTNALPYFTGSSAMGTTALTQAARDVLAGVDYAAIRAVLQLTSSAITPLQSGAMDNTVNRILQVGAFGLGSFNDLRTHVVATGTPADCFGIGTVFGFVNGGSAPAGGLAIPGLIGTFYGTLQVNGQYSDSSGLSAMSRIFTTTNGRTFTQAAASSSAWGVWTESWTSTNLVKTTSSSDSTAGRMLQTGDFGIGQQGVVVTNLNNLSNSGTGFYKLAAPFTGSPLSGIAVTVIHMSYDAERTQIAIPEGTGSTRMFFRKYVSSTSSWAPWVENYNTGNTDQIIADVTAGIQSTLDAKVNKSGDTMTGALILPTLEVGTTSSNGSIDIKNSTANSGNSDYDVRLTVDGSVAGTSGGGRLVLSAAKGLYSSGLITAANGVNVTGNMNASGTVQGSALVSTGTLSVAGAATMSTITSSGTVSGAALTATNNVTAAGGTVTLSAAAVSVRNNNADNSGNVHLWFYNNNNSERALIYVDSAANINIRSAGQQNTLTLNANRSANFGGAVSAVGRISCSADMVAATTVYSGNGSGWLAADGNIYGNVWGGYLSTYLTINHITPGNLPQNIVNTTGAGGAIGSYAFMTLTGNATVNDYVAGSSLRYSSVSSNSGLYAQGTWRCMGHATNNASLFMRIS